MDRTAEIIEKLKYSGRLAATEGNELTPEYIAAYFADLGLESPKGLDHYRRYFSQRVKFTSEMHSLEVIDEDGNMVKRHEFIKHLTTLTT